VLVELRRLCDEAPEILAGVVAKKDLPQPLRASTKADVGQQALHGCNHLVFGQRAGPQHQAGTLCADPIAGQVLIEIARNAEHGPASLQGLIPGRATAIVDNQPGAGASSLAIDEGNLVDVVGQAVGNRTAGPARGPAASLDPGEILALDEEGFRERFFRSAIWRATWSGLVRNARAAVRR